MQNDENKKTIEDKLTTIKYNCSDKTHLIVNQEMCKKCKNKPCTYICPAKVYNYDDYTDEVTVQYENCLECGACRIVCPYGTIEWSYPQAGYGVVFKNN